MAEQVLEFMGRGAFEQAPDHEVNNLCILAPARVRCYVYAVLLQETYLCLLEVARRKGTSRDGRRQLLSEGLNIPGALLGELFIVIDLCNSTFTDDRRVE